MSCSKLNEVCEFDLIGTSRRGRVGYYTCKSTIPPSTILKWATEERRKHPRYFAIKVSFLDDEDEPDMVKILEDNKNFKVDSTVQLKYVKSGIKGFMFRDAKPMKGGKTIGQIFEQGVKKEFDSKNPFSETNLYIRKDKHLVYGENFDPENAFHSSSDSENDSTLDSSIERNFFNDRLRWMQDMKSELDFAKGLHPDSNELPGITTPWYYIGTAFVGSSMHLEDFFLGSMNYLFKGSAPKHWLFIDAFDMQKLNKYLAKNYKDCPQGILHKFNVVTTELLDNLEIEYDIVEQREFDLIITFPRAAHQVVNEGKNCAIAKNWLPAGGVIEARSFKVCTCPKDEGWRWLWNYIYGSEIPMKMNFEVKDLDNAMLQCYELVQEQIRLCQPYYEQTELVAVASSPSNSAQNSNPDETSEVEPRIVDTDYIFEENNGFSNPPSVGTIMVFEGEPGSMFQMDSSVPVNIMRNHQTGSPSGEVETYYETREDDLNLTDSAVSNPHLFQQPETVQSTSQLAPASTSDNLEGQNIRHDDTTSQESITSTSHQRELSSPGVTVSPQSQLVLPFNFSISNGQADVSHVQSNTVQFQPKPKRSEIIKTLKPHTMNASGRIIQSPHASNKATPRRHPSPDVVTAPKKPRMINEIPNGIIQKQYLKEMDKRDEYNKSQRGRRKKRYGRSVPQSQNEEFARANRSRYKSLTTIKKQHESRTDVYDRELEARIVASRNTFLKNQQTHLLQKVLCKYFKKFPLDHHFKILKYSPYEVVRHFVNGTDDDEKTIFWKAVRREFQKKLANDPGYGLMEELEEIIRVEWVKLFEISVYQRIPITDPHFFMLETANKMTLEDMSIKPFYRDIDDDDDEYEEVSDEGESEEEN